MGNENNLKHFLECVFSDRSKRKDLMCNVYLWKVEIQACDGINHSVLAHCVAKDTEKQEKEKKSNIYSASCNIQSEF